MADIEELPENPFAEEAEDAAPELDPETPDEPEDSLVAEEETPTESDPKEAHVAKVVALGTFQKRVGKLVSQRKRAEEAKAAAETRAARAEGVLSEVKPIADKVRELYKGNLDQLAWDARFLAAMEEQASTDAAAAALVNKIIAGMKEKRPVTTTPTVTETSTAAPAVNVAVEKIALKTIKTELEGLGVRPEFANKIAKDAVAEYEATDLVDIDRKGVVKLTKSWLEENGFKSDDIVAKKATPGGRKLVTNGGSGKAADEPRKASDPKPKPKTREEVRASIDSNRDSAFADFAREFNAERGLF
jgi:hypothetical protein